MEPRSGLRNRTRGSVQPLIDHRQHNLTEAESSDEDDDDIPATKLPSVSPAKRHCVSPNAVTNHTKRSDSDAARGGIVLYPGSKKQRNGYNMVPASLKSLPLSTSRNLNATVAISRTPDHSASSSSGPEDDVPEGLLNTVNDAIRPRQVSQTQDYTEQPSQQAGASASHLVNNAHLSEPGGRGINIDIQEPPLAIPGEGLASSALPLPLNADVGNNLNAKPCQSTFGGSISATTSKEETGTEIEVDPQVSPEVDIWELPASPRQPNAQRANLDGGDDRRLPTKKRGRPRKLPIVSNMTGSSLNGAPVTRKRKQYPRLCNTADKDHRTRIEWLQGKSIPCADEPGAQLPLQSPPGPNATGLIQPVSANQLEQISPDDGACTRRNKSQLAPILDIQPKVEAEEEADRGVNHAILSVRNSFFEEDGDGDVELVSRNNDGFSGSNAEEDNEMVSDFMDGFDTDPGSGSGAGESIEENFEHDLKAFNTGKPHDVDDEGFEGPVDDDILAIHLDHQPLRHICMLLSDTSWAGGKGEWQWREFDYDDAETEPARALLPVLAKLERLYQAAPKAPNLKEQNAFLREHTNMLRYYFHKIKIVIDHIRTQRLEIPEQNEAAHNTNPRKRMRMTRDLVLYVVPMLVQYVSLNPLVPAYQHFCLPFHLFPKLHWEWAETLLQVMTSDSHFPTVFSPRHGASAAKCGSKHRLQGLRFSFLSGP